MDEVGVGCEARVVCGGVEVMFSKEKGVMDVRSYCEYRLVTLTTRWC